MNSDITFPWKPKILLAAYFNLYVYSNSPQQKKLSCNWFSHKFPKHVAVVCSATTIPETHSDDFSPCVFGASGKQTYIYIFTDICAADNVFRQAVYFRHHMFGRSQPKTHTQQQQQQARGCCGKGVKMNLSRMKRAHQRHRNSHGARIKHTITEWSIECVCFRAGDCCLTNNISGCSTHVWCECQTRNVCGKSSSICLVWYLLTRYLCNFYWSEMVRARGGGAFVSGGKLV